MAATARADVASEVRRPLLLAGAAAGVTLAAMPCVAAAKAAFVPAAPLQRGAAPAELRTVRSLRGVDAEGPSGGASASGALAAGLVVGGMAATVAKGAGRQGKKRSGAARRRVSTLEAPPKARESLAEKLPDCPRTIWKADDINIDKLKDVRKTSPLEIFAKDVLKGRSEQEYFLQDRETIMQQVQDHGAIWFRGFEMTKNAAGFRSFFESLQLNPCLDPIHTSGLREMVEKKDAVYEAVNKPSLAGHIVGLHNESTFVKTATYGAFVCFQKASGGGGEFTLADGAKIIKDMDPAVLKRIYERKVRISVSNLDLNFVNIFPEGLKEGAKEWLREVILGVVAPKFEMDLEMIYGADNSNPNRLQAIEHQQSPINRHPVTGQPVWFCNIHNHSRYLRDRRPCTVPEVGMTDVYYGDLSKIPPEDVEHINEVCERNLKPFLMSEGDVVLLDNYRVLHGRQTFKGERNHAVTWFESCGEPLAQEEVKDKPDDFMNVLINKTLV